MIKFFKLINYLNKYKVIIIIFNKFKTKAKPLRIITNTFSLIKI